MRRHKGRRTVVHPSDDRLDADPALFSEIATQKEGEKVTATDEPHSVDDLVVSREGYQRNRLLIGAQ
jgi:hypothetical protein